MPAPSTAKAASQACGLSVPPAASSARPTAVPPTAESPKPTIECKAIVAPRRAGSAAALMPAVRAPESAGTVIAYSSSSVVATQGEAPAVAPSVIATRAEASCMAVMARRRPKRIASSLPMMLAGIASSATTTLAAIGPNGAAVPWRATTKVQKATIHVRMPYSSKQWAP